MNKFKGLSTPPAVIARKITAGLIFAALLVVDPKSFALADGSQAPNGGHDGETFYQVVMGLKQTDKCEAVSEECADNRSITAYPSSH